MKKILNTVGLMSLGIVALIAVTLGGMMLTGNSAFARGNNRAPSHGDGAEERDPIPEGESVWEDEDQSKFKNKERMKNRPGNYEVLKLSYDFLSGIHQVEPELGCELAFPFQKDSKTFQSQREFDDYYKGREEIIRKSGRKVDNDFRAGNFVVNRLDIQTFEGTESAIDDPNAHLLSGMDAERFVSVRASHTGYCALVHIIYSMESLKDNGVRHGSNRRGFVLCWVKKDDGWKLVWFDK